MSKVAAFILDSPINAYMAAILSKKFDSIVLIYAIDKNVKNEAEYISTFRMLLSGHKIDREVTINYDSKKFWSISRKEAVKEVEAKFKPQLKSFQSYTIYGNNLTNPVGVMFKKYFDLHHLFHSPNEFHDLINNKKHLRFKIKTIIQRLTGIPGSGLNDSGGPIDSFIKFNSSINLNINYVSYQDFTSSKVQALLSSLKEATASKNKKGMLLLAGSEPLNPGDFNQSHILDYLQPHLESIEKILATENLPGMDLWLKEHKAYVSLTNNERAQLIESFQKLSCKVHFITDYLGPELRLLPGECILKYCDFDYIIAEPSALLFNAANGPAKPIVSITPFAAFRDENQRRRNEEFFRINSSLSKPCYIL